MKKSNDYEGTEYLPPAIPQLTKEEVRAKLGLLHEAVLNGIAEAAQRASEKPGSSKQDRAVAISAAVLQALGLLKEEVS